MYGISDTKFHIWKKKYSGLGLSELPELHQLREENGKLKRLTADLSWTALSCRRSCKKSCKARQRRALGHWTQAVFALSGRRAAG